MKIKKLMPSKKGQVGFDVAKSVILSLFVLGLLAFAVLIAMGNLNATSVATNDTTNIFNNISAGTTSFFSNATAWFGLLAVVVIILIVSIVLVAVRRFGGSGGDL